MDAKCSLVAWHLSNTQEVVQLDLLLVGVVIRVTAISLSKRENRNSTLLGEQTSDLVSQHGRVKVL